MTRLAIISLVTLAACHQPTGRENTGGGSYVPPVNIITGTPGDDFLQGTDDGPDIINGGAGDDVICGDPGCGALIEELKRRGL